MRFETRYDKWIVILLAAVFAVVLAVNLRTHSLISLVFAGIYGFVLLCTLPQHYILRENGLFIRQGWLKVLVPYEKIRRVRPAFDAMSAAVFSTRRVYLTAEGGEYVIAVREEQRFLDELTARIAAAQRPQDPSAAAGGHSTLSQ